MSTFILVVLVVLGIMYLMFGSMCAALSTYGNPTKLQERLQPIRMLLIIAFWPVILSVVYISSMLRKKL